MKAMEMEEVKLFGAKISPFSRRVEMALKFKGVKNEYIEEDLCNKSPMLLQYNPVYKKIPVLLHNGKPIVESLVILKYIDETWVTDPSIWPRDPDEKANARFWSKFVDEECMPALLKTIWSTGEQYEKDKAKAGEALKVFEGELKVKGKKFFGGDKIGAVDIVANFIGFSYRAIQEAIGLDVFTKENFPRLWDWANDCEDSGIIKEHLPSEQNLITNFPPRYWGEALVTLFQSRVASHSHSSAAAK